MQSVLWAIALVAATAFVSRLVSQALRHFLNRDSNPLPSSSIIINIGRGVVWATGISLILDACFGINANAIVAALGVGGIAVSLGFQDTLANLIGGLQVTFMGIVKPGDNIEVGAERGVVQDVTWRHTTIRDAMGQTVIIPNSIISKTALVHVAALGVGGIAVSLGFQDTLANLIGGLQVTFMGIVKPGDNIEVGAERGVVQDVTWRHTTIRDAMGQTVIIPNSIISKTALVHLLPASRVAVPFAVPRLSEDGHVRADDMDGLADQLTDLARAAASGVSPIVDGPRVLFSEISELGIKGGHVRADDMDGLADQLTDLARAAASGVSPIVDGPRVLFSEISELGIKGKIILQVEDATKTSAAADAVVRAIAALV